MPERPPLCRQRANATRRLPELRRRGHAGDETSAQAVVSLERLARVLRLAAR